MTQRQIKKAKCFSRYLLGLKHERVIEAYRIMIIWSKECFISSYGFSEKVQTIQHTPLFSPQHWSWIDKGTEQISQVNKVRCLPASLQLIVWRVVSLMGWLKMCSVSPNNTETTTVSSAKYKWKYCYLLSLFIYLKDLWTFQFVMNLNKPNF